MIKTWADKLLYTWSCVCTKVSLVIEARYCQGSLSLSPSFYPKQCNNYVILYVILGNIDYAKVAGLKL